MEWIDDHYCFVCGKDNPHGLHLDFVIKDNKIYTEYTFPKKFQGYADVVHGGMLGVILDEVMVNLPWKIYDIPVVSAELTLRLKKPVNVGEKLIFSGEIEKEIKNIIYTKGEAKLENGEVVAVATAKCMKVTLEKLSENLKKVKNHT